MTRPSPLTILSTVAVLCLLLAVLTICHQRGRIDAQKRDIAVAKTTGKALDKVAAETPVIRQDQQERQREVDKIEGAETRLPDGFGAGLERVRRGQRD